jgi:hypothetical protein
MPRVGTRDAASARSIECALWLAAGLAALTAEGFTPDGSRATWVLSLITVVHGLRVFLAHGAARTTALGLFAFAGSLFIGYAGMVAASAPQPEVSLGYITAAVAIGFFVQVSVTFFAWGDESSRQGPVAVADGKDARWLIIAGGLSLAILFVAYSAGLPDSLATYADGAAFTSVVLVNTGLLFQADTRPMSVRTILVAATFIVYALAFAEGTGRLRLVALACTVLILISSRFPLRIWKRLTVLVTPFGI